MALRLCREWVLQGMLGAGQGCKLWRLLPMHSPAVHSCFAAQFEKVLEAYRRASRQWSATLNRFAEVRMRGRKRAMVG